MLERLGDPADTVAEHTPRPPLHVTFRLPDYV